MKVQFICPSCGGDEILADAFAEWDTEQQEWILQNVFPDTPVVCNNMDCGETHDYDDCRKETP